MAGIGDIYSALQNGVTAINTMVVALKGTYTQISNTTAQSASAGSASSLPATPQAYLNVTVNGVPLKVPAYKP